MGGKTLGGLLSLLGLLCVLPCVRVGARHIVTQGLSFHRRVVVRENNNSC